MTDFKVTDEALKVALSSIVAEGEDVLHSIVFGLNTDDEVIQRLMAEEIVMTAIEAALPVMFEAVHQQRDAGGHWGDQDEAVKNWWDGRENAPMFRTVYRIKEPK